jgi:hypothetical protein
MYVPFSGKHLGKHSLRRPRRGWEDNIKLDLGRWDHIWIGKSQDWVQLWEMTLRFHCKKAVLLCVLLSLSQCNLLCSDFSSKRFETIKFPPHHTHPRTQAGTCTYTYTHTHTHTQTSFHLELEHTYPVQIQIYFIKHTFKIRVYWDAISHTLHTGVAQPPSF